MAINKYSCFSLLGSTRHNLILLLKILCILNPESLLSKETAYCRLHTAIMKKVNIHLFEIFTVCHTAEIEWNAQEAQAEKLLTRNTIGNVSECTTLLHPSIPSLDGWQMLSPSWSWAVTKIYFFFGISLLGHLEPWCEMLLVHCSSPGTAEVSAQTLWKTCIGQQTNPTFDCTAVMFTFLFRYLGVKWAGWGLAVWELHFCF